MSKIRLKIIIAALVAVIAGMVLLIVSQTIDGPQLEWLRSLLSAVGALLMASVALGLAWEFWGRASFLEDVMNRIGMAQNLERAGIRNVTNQYLHDVPWTDYIQQSKHVDLLFAYARTWRNSHQGELAELLRRPDARVRVVLPDTEDDATMADLARRYSYTPEQLAELITEAVDFFKDAHDPASGCSLRILMHHSPQVYSYYRFDRAGVIALYRQAGGRGLVPVIEFLQGGVLYQMLKDDFEDVVSESRCIHSA
jgi:hypothetical protein